MASLFLWASPTNPLLQYKSCLSVSQVRCDFWFASQLLGTWDSFIIWYGFWIPFIFANGHRLRFCCWTLRQLLQQHLHELSERGPGAMGSLWQNSCWTQEFEHLWGISVGYVRAVGALQLPVVTECCFCFSKFLQRELNTPWQFLFHPFSTGLNTNIKAPAHVSAFTNWSQHFFKQATTTCTRCRTSRTMSTWGRCCFTEVPLQFRRNRRNSVPVVPPACKGSTARTALKSGRSPKKKITLNNLEQFWTLSTQTFLVRFLVGGFKY